MKLSSLRIGGHTIKVIYTDLPDGVDGEFSTEDNTIRISKDIAESQQEATLLHEIMHVLNAQFDEGVFHVLLESLSQQLFQVLKDNKLRFGDD